LRVDQLHPRGQAVSLAPLWFTVGEPGQPSQMPPVSAGAVGAIDLSQPPCSQRGERGRQRLRADANPGLPSSGAGLNHHTRRVPLGAQPGEDAGNGLVQVQQDVAGIVIARIRPEVHVVAFAIADAQEAHRRGVRELGGGPLAHAGIGLPGAAVNQAHLVEAARHGGDLAAQQSLTDRPSTIRAHTTTAGGIDRCPARCRLAGRPREWPVARCAGNNRSAP